MSVIRMFHQIPDRSGLFDTDYQRELAFCALTGVQSKWGTNVIRREPPTMPIHSFVSFGATHNSARIRRIGISRSENNAIQNAQHSVGCIGLL